MGTRRLCCLVHHKILKNLIIFLGSTPIDNQRYRPLFKKQKFIDKFTEIRSQYAHKVIVPSPWGLNKSKFFIKKYFDIGDCSETVVMTVHSQCGGRPGFVETFLCELTNDANKGQFINVFDKKYITANKKTQYKHSEHHSKNKQVLSFNVNRNEMYGTFDPELDERFKIGLDVIFPIPPYIMSIAMAHCDKLDAEQTFILKIASVVCKSKGNNSIQFEEHMIRGCHPLAEMGMNNKKRLRATLHKLCQMKFIRKSQEIDIYSDDIGVDIKYKEKNTKKHTKALPSYNNFDQHYFENDAKTTKKKRNTESDLNHVDYTDFDGITDPMPATKALLQEPSKYVPYKKGKMYKRGVNFINMTETERTFVFKHRTLYWMKEENEEYPRSRIKFDQSVQKLKREDQRSCSIKTPRKEYILRCQKKKNMDQWFKLFKEALQTNYLSDTMMKRMKHHSNAPKVATTKNTKAPKSKMEELLNGSNTKKENEEDSNDEEWNDEMAEDVVYDLQKILDDEENEEEDDKINIELDKVISPQLKMVSFSKDKEECIGVKAGDSCYEFAYGFLRDIVYEQMLHNQRKQLHTNALKYIAKCLKEKNDDKLALLHTRHIECVQRYSDMLQGDDSQKGAYAPKRQSFFGKRAGR